MGILDRITSIFTASEKRSTKSYIDPKRFFANAASGAVVNSKTALGFTPVFCAVKLLSESISQIPIEICEKQADGNIIKSRETSQGEYDRYAEDSEFRKLCKAGKEVPYEDF